MSTLDRLLILGLLRMASAGLARRPPDYNRYVRQFERQRAAWARQVRREQRRQMWVEVAPAATVDERARWLRLVTMVGEGKRP